MIQKPDLYGINVLNLEKNVNFDRDRPQIGLGPENLMFFFGEPESIQIDDIRFLQDPAEDQTPFSFTENLSPLTNYQTPIQQCSAFLVGATSNSIKNFIANFVKMIKTDPGAKQIFMKIEEINPGQREKKFKRLIERLQKKMKQDGKKHTIQHLKNLLVYKDLKDRHYTQYLLKMCSIFIESYPQVVRMSKKMVNSNDNIQIIKVVRNLLKRCDIDDIQATNKQEITRQTL